MIFYCAGLCTFSSVYHLKIQGTRQFTRLVICVSVTKILPGSTFGFTVHFDLM